MADGTKRRLLLTGLVALGCGFGGAALYSASGLGDGRTRDYLLAHPEILPQMADSYQKQEARKRLADVAGEVATAFPGAVLGNPHGKVTLIEFTDYGCTFCRLSRAHVADLIRRNPDLKVVIREWPIFEGSDAAARMALAAARQGKFAAFHEAMFEAGPPSEDTILDAAGKAGLDLAKAQAVTGSGEVQLELTRNTGLAQQLGFTGTPSWIVGERILEGAVGMEALQGAIDQARGS